MTILKNCRTLFHLCRHMRKFKMRGYLECFCEFICKSLVWNDLDCYSWESRIDSKLELWILFVLVHNIIPLVRNSGTATCYLVAPDGRLQELHWFKQSYAAWFIDDFVCAGESQMLDLIEFNVSSFVSSPHFCSWIAWNDITLSVSLTWNVSCVLWCHLHAFDVCGDEELWAWDGHRSYCWWPM